MRTLFGSGIKSTALKGRWQCVMLQGYSKQRKARNCDLFKLGLNPLGLLAETRIPGCFVNCAQWTMVGITALTARSWETVSSLWWLDEVAFERLLY